MHANCRRGFTLIELLVVIAIIAILAAILFPVFLTAREAGRRSACLSNLKQISTAYFTYADSSGGRFPMSWRAKPAGELNPLNPDPAVTNANGFITWDAAIFRQIKNRGAFKCPSDGLKRSGNLLPRSYSMNDQAFRYLSQTYGNADISAKMRGMSPAEPPRPSKYVLMAEWFYDSGPEDAPWPKEQWQFNVLGSESYCARFMLPDKGEHNGRKGCNYLFFDGHAVYKEIGQLSKNENYQFDPPCVANQ